MVDIFKVIPIIKRKVIRYGEVFSPASSRQKMSGIPGCRLNTLPFNQVTDSYERLEYLGDAVLDYLISTIIISSESLDNLDPGRITDIRYYGLCSCQPAIV